MWNASLQVSQTPGAVASSRERSDTLTNVPNPRGAGGEQCTESDNARKQGPEHRAIGWPLTRNSGFSWRTRSVRRGCREGGIKARRRGKLCGLNCGVDHIHAIAFEAMSDLTSRFTAPCECDTGKGVSAPPDPMSRHQRHPPCNTTRRPMPGVQPIHLDSRFKASTRDPNAGIHSWRFKVGHDHAPALECISCCGRVSQGGTANHKLHLHSIIHRIIRLTLSSLPTTVGCLTSREETHAACPG